MAAWRNGNHVYSEVTGASQAPTLPTSATARGGASEVPVRLLQVQNQAGANTQPCLPGSPSRQSETKLEKSDPPCRPHSRGRPAPARHVQQHRRISQKRCRANQQAAGARNGRSSRSKADGHRTRQRPPPARRTAHSSVDTVPGAHRREKNTYFFLPFLYLYETVHVNHNDGARFTVCRGQSALLCAFTPGSGDKQTSTTLTSHRANCSAARANAREDLRTQEKGGMAEPELRVGVGAGRQSEARGPRRVPLKTLTRVPGANTGRLRKTWPPPRPARRAPSPVSASLSPEPYVPRAAPGFTGPRAACC